MRFPLMRVLRLNLLIAAVTLLSSCAVEKFPQDYYTFRNAGDDITSRLTLGMTIAEIRTVVADSAAGKYVKEAPMDAVRSDEEVMKLYTYATYPQNVLQTMRVGTPYKPYTFWVTAHSNVALFLFFDDAGRLRGWANYPSRFNFERYWHERMTSRLTLRTDHTGMTRAQVHSLLGLPRDVEALPMQRARNQYADHVWLSYDHFSDPPIRDRVKTLDVYVYALQGGGERRVYLGYREFPRFISKFVAKDKPRAQIPNPAYTGPDQDELVVWGYDHAWEEGERYMREVQGQSH